jgi:DNA-binding FadR family transcriptional regulator
MNSLADLTLEVVSVIDTPRTVKEGICRFHRQIFEAVAAHDEEAAHRLMLEHIGQVQDGIGETIAQALQIDADPESEGTSKETVLTLGMPGPTTCS